MPPESRSRRKPRWAVKRPKRSSSPTKAERPLTDALRHRLAVGDGEAGESEGLEEHPAPLQALHAVAGPALAGLDGGVRGGQAGQERVLGAPGAQRLLRLDASLQACPVGLERRVRALKHAAEVLEGARRRTAIGLEAKAAVDPRSVGRRRTGRRAGARPPPPIIQVGPDCFQRASWVVLRPVSRSW